MNVRYLFDFDCTAIYEPQRNVRTVHCGRCGKKAKGRYVWVLDSVHGEMEPPSHLCHKCGLRLQRPPKELMAPWQEADKVYVVR